MASAKNFPSHHFPSGQAVCAFRVNSQSCRAPLHVKIFREHVEDSKIIDRKEKNLPRLKGPRLLCRVPGQRNLLSSVSDSASVDKEHSPAIMAWIRQQNLPALRQYKYSGVDHSLVSKYILKPFYSNFVIKLFPMSMA